VELPVTSGAQLYLRAQFAATGAGYQVMGSEPKGLTLA
jgi:hypothetical protein